MKYSIQETNEKVAPYKLYRYDEYAGVPNNAELEFWMRIQELELESENSMEAAISLLEDRPMKKGGFAHLLFCNGGCHERIGDGTNICNCPLGKRIRGFKKKIQELETALTNISTMPEYDQDDAHRLRNMAKRALADYACASKNSAAS